MQPELTAEMCAELLSDEMAFEEVMVMKAYSMILRGYSKEYACQASHITVKYYDANKNRILNPDVSIE